MNPPMLDPGHGPGDGSMAGMTSEHEYAWKMAQRVSEARDWSVRLSRVSYNDPTNAERASVARERLCPFTVSLHVNAGPPEYHGAHAFYWAGSRFGNSVATAIMKAWPSDLSRDDMDGRALRGMYVEGSVVPMDDGARYRWPRVANVFDAFKGQELVLVEMYYGTNPREDELAHQPLVQDEMALAIARGLVVGQRLSSK